MKSKSSSVRWQLRFFEEYLTNPEYTEIVVNDPGVVWTLGKTWQRHENSDITEIELESLATAVSWLNHNKLSESNPIMSASLHKDEGGRGERIHFTCSPVTETHTLTIRKPSSTLISIDQYRESGFFNVGSVKEKDNQLSSLYENQQYYEFLEQAVAMGKTIVVSGGTNSGKTTLMKTLVRLIPQDQRVITCEDTAELMCDHPNSVAKLYKRSKNKNDKKVNVTADEVLSSTLRMSPNRIIFGELRGGECMAWLNAVASGHGGSIVSVHAGSVEKTFRRLELMALMSNVQLPYEPLKSLVESVVDVVVHIGENRQATDIFYRP